MDPLIIADDFSGACDAAARTGLGRAFLSLPPDSAGPLALSTETRHATPDEARFKIRSLEPVLDGRMLYKKIDSTLRGPWIDEVDEILLITGYSQAIVCPAFPALGRTVRNGWLFVNDEPEQRIVCPFTVRDAATEDDLARLAGEVCSSILPVGSAGLARHVFRPLAHSPTPLASAGGLWLVLVGSDHPISQKQVHVLEQANLENVRINPEVYPATLAGVFVTGGETASRFLRQTEACGIIELREALPGVPAGRILGGRYDGTVIITKAGGFGEPDTILRALGLFLCASASLR